MANDGNTNPELCGKIFHRQKDRASLSMGRTINLGNFESVRIDLSFASDLGKEETSDRAFARLEKMVCDQLNRLCSPIESKLAKTTDNKE